MLLCPYCGSATPPGSRCAACRGLLDPLSRQASQNAMGPWFVRDASMPFMPGCSYETLVGMVKRGRITKRTVLRGPTTRQFWCTAERTPGVSHLLGVCHNCRVDVQPTDSFCDECGAGFTVEPDRQHLGLGAVHVLPGQAAPVTVVTGAAREAAERDEGDEGEEVVPEADFSPLINTLRSKVRRQRVAMVLLVLVALGAALAAAWQYAPAELRKTMSEWVGADAARGGGAVESAPVPVRATAPPGGPAAAVEPTLPESAARAAETPAERDAPTSPAPAPEEGPGTGTGKGASPAPVPVAPARSREDEAGVLIGLAGERGVEALERAAAGYAASPEIQRVLHRRAAQVRLRSFP